jgi:prepilin-type processing-associated H-X9-DG protein
LVELLVVIGIIAVLISLLMPSLSKARRAANETMCLSNVRQVSMAMISYCNEHKGNSMPVDHNPGMYWHHLLGPHLGVADYAQTADTDHMGTGVFFCPEAREKSGGQGSATLAWQYFAGGGSGSYGLNLWLLPRGAFAGFPNADDYFPRFASVPRSSEVPFIGDSIWVGSWPDEDDAVPPRTRLQTGVIDHSVGAFMGRFYIDRHRLAINVGFCDGSARRLRLAELWEQRWHRNSQPRQVVAP